MIITEERRISLIGTATFAVLLLLILIFSKLYIFSPPDELEGIPVMFGSVPSAGGIVEPPRNEITPTPTEPVVTPPRPTVDDPIITQNTEPTIDIAAQREAERRRQEQQAADAARRAEEQRIAAEQRRAEEQRQAEERQAQAIRNQVSGLFGENQGSRGETEGTGTQGVTTGNTTQGAPTGSGGVGTFDLGGRSLGSGGLRTPAYTANDFGTVVVNITVNPAGNVIHAEIGRGTNTPNASLRNEAMRAAQATRFNTITGTNNQTGTITYRFNLN
ncbi:MAG: TonB family protein [Dysgonamonadaceae bacterium]|jgi:TonB family protein|nr:TonB family protein [Dysgonamonadaceae bacterium]